MVLESEVVRSSMKLGSPPGNMTRKAQTKLFPFFLKLGARRCLVVGAGSIGETKSDGLLEAGAKGGGPPGGRHQSAGGGSGSDAQGSWVGSRAQDCLAAARLSVERPGRYVSGGCGDAFDKTPRANLPGCATRVRLMQHCGRAPAV